jgi:hypothetical protein
VAWQSVKQETAHLMSQGMTQQSAMFAAMATMVQQLKQQAYLLAMNDAFLVTLTVIFLTVFIVLFVVRVPRKKGVPLPKSDHMAHEGIPMEEEEPIAVLH